ncbi:MAG: peptidylprolyl isomerase, partial [Clostridia bacterium]|nr:peptidylprolyl isomerase [Clostridia bacterium]
TLAYRDELAARYGEYIWTDAALTEQYRPLLIEHVKESLKINAAIVDLCAEFNIDINSVDIQKAVQDEIDATVEALGGRAVYKKMIKEMYMTDRFIRYSYAADLCESLLCQTLVSAELIVGSELDFVEYAMNDEVMCATYQIYIENDKGDSVEQNRQRAEEVRNLLLSGTDIKALIGSSYNEDVSAPSIPYYFMRGEYEPSYEQAAFALDIGEVSEVIEGENGFYVIVRQELKQSQLVANLTELYQRYQYIEVEALLAEHRDAMTLEWTEYGEKIDLVTMK